MGVEKATCPGFAAQFAKSINNLHTEFVFHIFENRWFIMVTQYGGIPNLFTVKFDLQQLTGTPMPFPINHPQFHASVPITMTCNFGADKDEIRSSIQFLIDKSKLNTCPTEMVIALGLKEYNSSNLREIGKILDEIIA